MSAWEELAEVNMPWRVGRSIGRTIYACPPGSTFREGEQVIAVGLGTDEDSVRLAAHIVELHNWWFELKCEGAAAWEQFKQEHGLDEAD